MAVLAGIIPTHAVIAKRIPVRPHGEGQFFRVDRMASVQTGRNPHSIVTVITARSALEVTISSMGGDGLSPKHLCPGCGRLMGLSRIVPASPGWSELRTYGCKECGVWVTEGSTPRDQRPDTFVVPK